MNMSAQSDIQAAQQSRTDKFWLTRQFHADGRTMTPEELEKNMKDPPGSIDDKILDRVHGSMLGMALGDALGAFVEFRPHAFLEANPVDTLTGGGTWGLKKGQFTDDTSMALCLANSLVARQDYIPYDQLVRYNWWYKEGYMSSTGTCFDIGAATRQSLELFRTRQRQFAAKHNIDPNQMDSLPDSTLLEQFDVNCSDHGVAGNGALMRLAPVPLFFYRDPVYAIKCSGHSGEITHGDEKAYDACRYYGALIVAALGGAKREELLDPHFYENHIEWFDGKPLQADILKIAHGSYQKEEGYAGGIRGKGYIVSALEAALWAFWSDKGDYKTGVLSAVNLGDDTDTTAAIYGQLAGVVYGFKKLPEHWKKEVYAKGFIECLSKWIVYEGEQWSQKRPTAGSASEKKRNLNALSVPKGSQRRGSLPSEQRQSVQTLSIPDSEQSTDPKTKFRPRRNTIHPRAANSQINPHAPDTTSQPTTANEENVQPPPSSGRVYFHNEIESCEDVCRWLRSIGTEYEPYVEIFRRADLDGYWLLNQLDEKQLIEKGVTSKGHRQVIFHRIEELKRKCPVRHAASKK